MALPAKNRLPLRSERDRITREGKTFHTKFFTVVVAPINVIPSEVEGSHTIYPRFAILLSKKTAKLAVDRNRIKRVTSSALIELLLSLPPLDYLIIPKRSVLETDLPSLLSDLKSLLTPSSSRA